MPPWIQVGQSELQVAGRGTDGRHPPPSDIAPACASRACVRVGVAVIVAHLARDETSRSSSIADGAGADANPCDRPAAASPTSQPRLWSAGEKGSQGPGDNGARSPSTSGRPSISMCAGPSAGAHCHCVQLSVCWMPTSRVESQEKEKGVALPRLTRVCSSAARAGRLVSRRRRRGSYF